MQFGITKVEGCTSARLRRIPSPDFNRVIVFPTAKINIGLNVVRKRADGYHDIETVMLPVPLCDALEAVVDTSIAQGKVEYTRSGLEVAGDPSSDLVMRAHEVLCHRHALPGLRMHLHKRIPMGAGLGGGSSDGAHAIVLLDRLLGLRMGMEEMRSIALSLGSDCPFFLTSGAQIARGRGELLEPVQVDLRGAWLVLVNPGIAVPTAEVYANVKATGVEAEYARVLESLPMARWREAAPNVMEEYVFGTRPTVKLACERLLEEGAEHAAMSGSGSTVFGLFRQNPPTLDWPKGHSVWILQLG